MPQHKPRDPVNPDYGGSLIRTESSLALMCEGCGDSDFFQVDREPLDKVDAVFIRMSLLVMARREGWRTHVQEILCPKCHLNRAIARDFQPEKLTDDSRYVDLTDPSFRPGETKHGEPPS